MVQKNNLEYSIKKSPIFQKISSRKIARTLARAGSLAGPGNLVGGTHQE